MLALLFSIQSVPNIAATTLPLPIAQLFVDATGGGGREAVGKNLALMCLVVVGLAQGMAAVTAFAASARLLYALARDNACPRGVRRALLRRNKGQAPYVGVWVSVFVGCAISCAYIGSATAVSRPVPSGFGG
jgi:amino acid transporter